MAKNAFKAYNMGFTYKQDQTDPTHEKWRVLRGMDLIEDQIIVEGPFPKTGAAVAKLVKTLNRGL